MQLILSGVERRDNLLNRFADVCGGTLVKEWDGNSIPVMIGNLNGGLEIQQHCIKEKKTYVLIDHGYFHRDFNLYWARFCVDNYHCTDFRDSDRQVPDFKPYREGQHIVIIPPAPMISKLYGADNWVDETMSELRKYTDRKIFVKHKGEGELSTYLKKAHALVSFGSVSEIEAALDGIPVFCSKHSPAVPISQELKDIENPSHPDRIKWLRSIAACEWNISELDKCWERLNEHIHLLRTANSSH